MLIQTNTKTNTKKYEDICTDLAKNPDDCFSSAKPRFAHLMISAITKKALWFGKEAHSQTQIPSLKRTLAAAIANLRMISTDPSDQIVLRNFQIEIWQFVEYLART